MSSNIFTTVRVRPFNSKEIANKTKNVISMSGNQTKIQFKDKTNSFNYDNCFWSHDGYVTNASGYTEPANAKYTDQKTLFLKLGKPLLDNAWAGYNCSLFAYGQTGSGKTYSVMGYKENKGLVPMICENLFAQIAENNSKLKDGEKYQVTMGMLEIYNEKVRDLLTSNSSEYLSIKEDQSRGFFAPNQSMMPVNSYEAILKKIEFGNKQRTIASTNMNETSSRAHTIVSLQFIQIIIDSSAKLTRKTSFINLIDLAGSEKVKKSQAEGARLTEAQNINKSLLTLGQCLNSLSTKQSHVPYRDSVLTKLLMNALGGNSKTVLLAAISPADSNYEESLSTLRFAERAKKVSTQAKVNITQNDAAIKKLAEENKRLQDMLKDLENKKATKDSSKEIDELQNQILRNKAEAEASMLSWKEIAQQVKDELERMKKAEEEGKQKLMTRPHIYNLNEDPALNKLLVYVFEKPVTVLGNSKAQKDVQIDIDLQGINIQGKHAEIRYDEATKKTFIKPLTNADVFINGTKLTKEYEMQHYDRILLGNSLYFFHHDPLVSSSSSTDSSNITEPTIEIARKEITEKIQEFKGLDNIRLNEELSTVFPLVQEANAMATEMKKKVIYSLIIFPSNLPGYNDSPEPQLVIRVFLTTKNMEYFLDINEFTDMRYGMLDMYHDFKDGSVIELGKDTFDPFIPRESQLCCVGFTHALLTTIKYLLEYDDYLPITNYQGKVIGSIKFKCIPCDSSWNPCEFSEKEIAKGSKLYLKLSVDEIKFEKTNFKKVYYYFKFSGQIIKSPMSNIVNDVAKFSYEYKVDGIIFDDNLLKYLEKMIGIEIWGCYEDAGTTSATKDSNAFDGNNVAAKQFLEDFQKLAIQRANEGHSGIEFSEIAKIVPKDFVPPSASKICLIQ